LIFKKANKTIIIIKTYFTALLLLFKSNTHCINSCFLNDPSLVTKVGRLTGISLVIFLGGSIVGLFSVLFFSAFNLFFELEEDRETLSSV
jgi:hypothetical protein